MRWTNENGDWTVSTEISRTGPAENNSRGKERAKKTGQKQPKTSSDNNKQTPGNGKTVYEHGDRGHT